MRKNELVSFHAKQTRSICTVNRADCSVWLFCFLFHTRRIASFAHGAKFAHTKTNGCSICRTGVVLLHTTDPRVVQFAALRSGLFPLHTFFTQNGLNLCAFKNRICSSSLRKTGFAPSANKSALIPQYKSNQSCSPAYIFAVLSGVRVIFPICFFAN